MNAVLLCPGPSLTLYKPGDEGIVIGVNRAACFHACDVWAATDWPLIRRTEPKGRPTLFTITATEKTMARRNKPWPRLVVTHEAVAGDTVTNTKYPWTRFTSTAALAFLHWVGAEQVDVYGADMNGVADWDGVKAGENRSDVRWEEERKIWDQTVNQTRLQVVRHHDRRDDF